MRLHIIKTIVFKEIREIFRDKKTMFFLILFPFFLYPFLIILLGQFSLVQKEKISAARINIRVDEAFTHTPLYDSLKKDKQFVFITSRDTAAGKDILIRSNNLFAQAVSQNKTASFTIYYNATDDYHLRSKQKIENAARQLGQQLLLQRLAQYQQDSSFVKPVQTTFVSSVSRAVQTGDLLGRYLPAMLLLFVFVGVIYTAMDITAGEKERKTLQSIYAAPLSRGEIVAGKFFPVFLMGLFSGVANLLGLLIAMLWQSNMIKGGSALQISLEVSLAGWAWMLLLLILITTLISGLCMAVLLMANSYKEASSYVSPLMMLFMVPGFLYSLPAMQLDSRMALIPVLNVLLAFKELFKGSLNWSLLFMTMAVSLAYSLLCIYLASLSFASESIITGQRVNYREMLKESRRGARRFGATEALLFFALVLLLFLYIGLPLQTRLDLRLGLPLSFLLVLGGLSLLAMFYFRMDIKETLPPGKPNSRSLLGTLLLALSLGWPLQYFTRGMIPEDFAEEFTKTLQPLLDLPIPLSLVFMALLPAVFEELVIRGVMFKGLMRDWGKWPVIIVSALAFAVLHLSVYRLFPTMALGLVLGYIRWESRSILLCSLLHFVYNGSLVLLSRPELGIFEEGSWLTAYPQLSVPLALLVSELGLWLIGKKTAATLPQAAV